jgi:hypothetical protein
MASPLVNACEDMIAKAAVAVPELQHVAMWNSQIQKAISGTGDPFDMPALFIELLFGAQHNLGTKVTETDITWRLHIAHQQLAGTPDHNIVVIPLRDKIKKAYMGYRPAGCGRLQYVTEKPDTDHGNIYHYTLDLICGFIDTKGSPYDPDAAEWIIKEPPTAIEINIDKENQL